MLTPPFKLKLPAIAESEQTPIGRSLLQIIAEQQEQIQRLEDEVRCLKGGPLRPPLKLNTLEPAGPSGTEDPGTVEDDAPRRRGPGRAKTAELAIHVTEWVTVAGVPAGSAFKGYRRFVAQDLDIRAHNTCYLLEHWRFPNGDYVTAPVPPTAGNGHYGSTLISYVLYQLPRSPDRTPLPVSRKPAISMASPSGSTSKIGFQDRTPSHHSGI
jgi:hypothetical protein